MAMINVSALRPGQIYTRPQLATLWGYESWRAFGRGIFTPRDQRLIVLFVTRFKQVALEQYRDYFDGHLLHMEGERDDEPEANAANRRLEESRASKDVVVLFYREVHHRPFVYYGQVWLREVEPSPAGRPPTFVFDTSKHTVDAGSSAAADDALFEGAARSGTHTYYERSATAREDALQQHGRRCRACDFDFDAFYGADLARGYIQVHHVESITRGARAVDPTRDLIPLCANCHCMVHRTPGTILSVKELRRMIAIRRRFDSRLSGEQLRDAQ
jgi:5-methylcytosine-specific restriction protein A